MLRRYFLFPIFLSLFQDVISFNHYLNNFETLNYEPLLNNSKIVFVNFHSYNRTFNLKLCPVDINKSHTFSNDYSLHIDGDYDSVNPNEFLFSGEVIGDPFSHVYGSIFDGVFDGHIVLGNGQSYSVEKVARYFYFDVDERPKNYHSIIYSSFSNEINFQNSVGFKHRQRIAVKRQKRELKQDLSSVRTCSLHLQADHKLYAEIYNKEGNQDHDRTKQEIVSLFYNHIKAVNEIYENTDFGGILGLNFVIQQTTIYTNDSCINGRPAFGSDNPFCEENVDVTNYLNLNSQRNHSAFCLTYALTFRDFNGGTLGLAHVSSPNDSLSGGICERYQRYYLGPRGTVFRSLNTGVISFAKNGERLPARTTQLALAHEFGHSLGAEHDSLKCQSSNSYDGNYIMFGSILSGKKPNHSRLSQCSIDKISAVLHEILKQSPTDHLPNKKRNCLLDRQNIVE